MNNSITKKQLKEFGLVIGLGFPILIGWIIPIIYNHNFRSWTIIVGLIFCLFGILKPKFLFYPYKAWMKLGNILGWINSKLILGIIFIFVLEPISLIMKITGYDPLRLKKSNKISFREDKSNHKIDLNRIF